MARQKNQITKRSEVVCKIPTGRKPTRAQYAKSIVRAIPLLSEFRATLFTGAKARAAADPLPKAHAWPAYGGKCWQQAWEKMGAFQILTQAARLYLSMSSGSGCKPPQQLIDQAFGAYVLAKKNYLIAWTAMESCLTGAVV
jgi:hypothetical protein